MESFLVTLYVKICNFTKERLCGRSLLVNFATFLRTCFLKNTFGPMKNTPKGPRFYLVISFQHMKYIWENTVIIHMQTEVIVYRFSPKKHPKKLAKYKKKLRTQISKNILHLRCFSVGFSIIFQVSLFIESP